MAGFLGLGASLPAADVAWSVNVALTSHDSSVYFNPITGATSSDWGAYQFSISNWGSASFNQTVIAGIPSDTSKVIHVGGPDAKNLAYESQVDAAGPFWGSANLATAGDDFENGLSNFAAGETGYIGLTFVENEQTFCGWASIVRAEDSAFVMLTGFGYNSTPGEAAMVGVGTAPIPEPASASVLAAMGALAAVGLRRRERR